MLQADRDTIEVNIPKLVRHTDYKRLMNCCLERRLLFDVMRTKIELNNDTDTKRLRATFMKLTKRGPTAYAALLQLLEAEFPDALRILDKDISIKRYRPAAATAANPNQQNQNHLNPLASSTTNPLRPPTQGQPGMQPPNANERIPLVEFTAPLPPPTAFERVRHSTQFHGNQPNAISCYPMYSRQRGVAFIVNIIHFANRPKEPRNGAKVDKVNLVQLFRQMGFVVLYYEDLTAAQLRQLLVELSQSGLLRRTDSFVMALMTHGTMLGGVEKVEFTDNGFLDLSEVLQHFSNKSSEVLVNKPKIFLFPFCRGSKLEQPVQRGQRKSVVAGVGGGGSGSGQTSSDAAQTNVTADSDSDDDASEVGVERKSIGGATVAATDAAGASAGASDAVPMRYLPVYSDMKICYATGPGFEAMREPDTGSWYIESLCSIWAKHAHDKSLDDLLKMVGEHQSNKLSRHGNIQTAHNKDRGFFKNLYFNPGYYGEEAAEGGEQVGAMAAATTAMRINDVTADV